MLTFRFERPPITEPKVWWHKMAVKRKDVYRRLALEHVGAESIISEHTIVRAHDRSYPLLPLHPCFAATDTKVTVVYQPDSQDRESGVRNKVLRSWVTGFRSLIETCITEIK
jgi:hypothetical protein